MTEIDSLDPRTPILVGVGQSSERPDDSDYQGLSAVGLAALAAERALADTGVDGHAVARAIDTVAAVRQFEISFPGAFAPLGRSDNFPRSVADRVGADPARAILEVVGGQSPQHLVTEFAGAIAAGRANAVLIVGAEAISTARQAASRTDKPDFSEVRGGQLEDRGHDVRGLMTMDMLNHGLLEIAGQYALFENARRAATGLSLADHARDMGELFAPFTRVAAANPHAAAPVERSGEELTTVTERNRMITDPYTRFVVSRDQVNQGAAVVMVSVAEARRWGIPEERWVFLRGHADLVEKRLLNRPDLSAYPAAIAAVRHALDVANIGVDGVATVDLYSCFPIAVSTLCDGLGLRVDDPRGLTVTGGLPFFGGAGNNYSMHAIAETVQHARRSPGTFGLVGANGGSLSKYSVGVYSTVPANWVEDDSPTVQAELDAVPDVEYVSAAHGRGIIETFTVNRGGGGARGIVVGRLPDGRRFLANAIDGDEAMLDLLSCGDPVGTAVVVRRDGPVNRVALTVEAMNAAVPQRDPSAGVASLRDDFEFVRIRRDGRVLEVTIDRPDQRNALTPQANEELDEVFDAFFADSEMWVAILTGAGTRSFSAGNDLRYSASGKPMWFPQNGFAGLTSRRDMNKPVIAAVNGFAMGGGFEIALACHLVVADEEARFALSEVRVGLVAAAGGLVRLPRAVPRAVATDMILTGRQIDAREAHALGVVSRVVDAGCALDGARALAAELLAASPTSIRTSLSMMAEAAAIPDVVDAVERPYHALDDLLTSEDALEGLTAFGAKREPVWKNR